MMPRYSDHSGCWLKGGRMVASNGWPGMVQSYFRWAAYADPPHDDDPRLNAADNVTFLACGEGMPKCCGMCCRTRQDTSVPTIGGSPQWRGDYHRQEWRALRH